MLNILFQVIFIEQEAREETCTNCKEEIKGKSYTMMLDFGDPVNIPPKPIDLTFCEKCKEIYEK